MTGDERALDRNTPAEPLPPKLVCPVCGSGDNLVSWEMDSVGQFGVKFFQNPDDPTNPEIDYDSADPKAGDEGSGFIDDLQCQNHDITILELTAADLVPEGTPPNPIWQWPADRATKVGAEYALDLIATKLSEAIADAPMLEEIADIVRTTGRTVAGDGTGRTHG